MQLPLDEATNLLIWSEEQCTLAALHGLVVAAEPAKHIGASEVKRRVVFQCAAAVDVLEQRKALDWAYREGDGNGPIQLDDGRALVVQELFVQDGNLPPIRVRGRRCLGMNRRNRTLNLIGTWPPHPKGTLDVPNALVDLRAVPLVPILILEKHQIAFVADARLAPRVVEQHERQQADGLGLVRKERGQTASKAKSIGDEIAADEVLVRRCQVAFVEHEVQDIENGVEARRERLTIRNLVRDAGTGDLLLRASDSLSDRRVGDEERASDFSCAEPTERAERQRDLRLP